MCAHIHEHKKLVFIIYVTVIIRSDLVMGLTAGVQ